MRLIQYVARNGERKVGLVSGPSSTLTEIKAFSSVREMALAARRAGLGLAELVRANSTTTDVDYNRIVEEGRLFLPLDHPEPSRCTLAITGLTHTGSALSRDAMHTQHGAAPLTDTMKLFNMGLEGGKPKYGAVGVQSEWAYKGDGRWAVAPGGDIVSPSFALDGGEEAEIAGLYVIGDQGEVLRVGFALANEFSDHLMEKQNYLYLAHSKLRQCSFGPEILIGDLPAAIRGTVRIVRDCDVVWSGEFLSGEDHMSHSVANLEHHHFKYQALRRPGDVHVYFYGASTLSFSDGVTLKDGDRMEIESDVFGKPLTNRFTKEHCTEAPKVIQL
jgi:hypothetical protein